MLELFPDMRPEWIVYRDDDVIVVDKPPGVPSQAAEVEHDDDLPARLKRFLGRELGVAPVEVYLGVHQRLDRDTSGLVLYTLRREANAGIAAQFEARTIEKTYLAVVEGGALSALSGERVLEHALARGRDGRMEVVANGTRAATRARTRVALERRVGERTLLRLGCDTGRTHQLRVQLAHEGSPIAGDRLYRGAPAPRLMLHAAKLALRHPSDGRALEFSAKPPLELGHFLEHGPTDAVTEPELFARALERALASRYRLGRTQNGEASTRAFRLLHLAADGVPELAVDLYAEHLVAHFFGDVVEHHADAVLDALAGLGCAGIYLKRHARQKNELSRESDPRRAPPEPVRGRAAPAELIIEEQGLPFAVRLGDGLRTGLFLDQRDNRARVRKAAAGKRVLNLFAYTGGFSVAALAGGAVHVLSVDASAAALEWARRNVERIGAGDRHASVHADVFDALRKLARKRERYDLIIVDPPSYSKTRSQRFSVTKDYAALCEACLRVLAPGGELLCCVNHHGMSQSRLRRELKQAAQSAGRVATRLKDLPTQLDFPAETSAEPHMKSVFGSFT